MSKFEGLLYGDKDAITHYKTKAEKVIKNANRGYSNNVVNLVRRYSHLWDALEQVERVDKQPTHADVILFRSSGKYYTDERWEIPEGAIGPHDMKRSMDFRRIGGGAVLIPSQEPWGFPHLFPHSDEDWDDARIQSGTSVILTESANRYTPSRLKEGAKGKVISVDKNWFGETIYQTEVDGVTYPLYPDDITRKD